MINGLIYYKRISKMIPSIKNNYTISTAGEIFSDSAKFNHIEQQMTPHQDNWGYLQIRLMTTEGVTKSFTVHRLVMRVFCPIPNDYLYQVNHIDGNKTNNNIWNLEWCTPSQNLKHAYDNGLRRNIVGEERINSNINNAQAELICQKLDEGMKYADIIKLIYDMPYPVPDGIRNIIYKIHHRKSWNWMSEKYKFDIEINNSPRILTDEQVHFVCRLFEQNIFDYKVIIEKLGYKLNDLSRREIEKLRDAFSSIRRGEHYKNISSEYQFKKRTDK